MNDKGVRVIRLSDIGSEPIRLLELHEAEWGDKKIYFAHIKSKDGEAYLALAKAHYQYLMNRQTTDRALYFITEKSDYGYRPVVVSQEYVSQWWAEQSKQRLRQKRGAK